MISNYAVFQPYGISDHSPLILKIPQTVKAKPKPFKLSNVLAHKKEFSDAVKDGWFKEVIV